MSSNVSSDDEEPEEEPDILGNLIISFFVYDQHFYSVPKRMKYSNSTCGIALIHFTNVIL